MSNSVIRSPTVPISNKRFISMHRKLRQLGFSSMSDMKESDLRVTLPPGFPSSGREVMTKAAGRSIARFVFTINEGMWELEQTLSRPMDLRAGLLIEAYPDKKHGLERRTYEATITPVMDEGRAVSHIDDLNVFLAGIDDDDEITEAVDAQKIKRRLQKMGNELEGTNSMASDFLSYIQGFVTHCDELWAWQIQRLRMDTHARTMMGRIADKL